MWKPTNDIETLPICCRPLPGISAKHIEARGSAHRLDPRTGMLKQGEEGVPLHVWMEQRSAAHCVGHSAPGEGVEINRL